jgi:hypothetical protein
MLELKRFSLVKPTVDTPFHIDFDWWKKQEKDWRVYLFSFLCQAHQETFSDASANAMIDWVDPQTAVVTQVDGLQHVLMTHCATQPGFITQNTSLVDSVFRVLLAGGNNPMTPKQLEEAIGRPAETILRTLSGVVVYKGMRPMH